MDYMSVEEAAQKWGVSIRSVQLHCQKGNVQGVVLSGKAWRIPSSALRPMRKPRAKGRPSTILAALKSEKDSRIKGALYHKLQVDFTYNSNHIEGSRLTHEQTRWIFETHTIGSVSEDIPIDDIVETANHFRCVDMVIESAGAALTERFVKTLHAILKSGTVDGRRAWFSVGDYKKLDNVVGEMETCPTSQVPDEMQKLFAWYARTKKTLEDILEFHVRFEGIHPFQDGNGRIGRLIMLKECLKYVLCTSYSGKPGGFERQKTAFAISGSAFRIDQQRHAVIECTMKFLKHFAGFLTVFAVHPHRAADSQIKPQHRPRFDLFFGRKTDGEKRCVQQHIQITLVVGNDQHTLFDVVIADKIHFNTEKFYQKFAPVARTVRHPFDSGTAAHSAEK